jgi:TRAP transporter TAXI family solute receptor
LENKMKNCIALVNKLANSCISDKGSDPVSGQAPRRTSVVLAATLVIAGVAASSAAIAQDKKLLIGTTSASSSHYGYFVAASQVINKGVAGISTTVVETGSSMDNMRRLPRNQIDMALVTTNVLHDAWNGNGTFKDNVYKPLTLWIYSYSPQNVVVREDSGLKLLADVGGKQINPGMSGSATEATSQKVFEALGLAPKWVRGSTGDIVDSIKDKRIVGYVKSGAAERLDSSSIDIATRSAVRILGIDDKQESLIRKAFPNLSVVNIAKDAAGAGYPAYKTWAFANAVVVRPDLDENTAYQMVKAVVADQTVQSAAFGGLKGSMFPKQTMEMATTPLHPGAVRFYKEMGIEIPKHLLPPG